MRLLALPTIHAFQGVCIHCSQTRGLEKSRSDILSLNPSTKVQNSQSSRSSRLSHVRNGLPRTLVLYLAARLSFGNRSWKRLEHAFSQRIHLLRRVHKSHPGSTKAMYIQKAKFLRLARLIACSLLSPQSRSRMRQTPPLSDRWPANSFHASCMPASSILL